MYFWHILWFLTCIVEIPLFLASSTNPRIFFWIWKNHFVCKSEWNSKWTTLSWSSFARNSLQYIFVSCSLYMLASHADGLRGSSLIPNAWRYPKNVCVGGYIYVFEKKKKKFRTSIIHGQILPQHFHYIHFTQLIDQRNLTTEKYHKKDGSRALQVDFQSRLIIPCASKKLLRTYM